MSDPVEVTEREIPVAPSNGSPTVEPETRPQDAPWGYKDDGTPYKRDPSIYKARDARKRGGRRAPSKTKAKVSPYAETVSDLVNLIAGPFAIAGLRDPAFLADAVMLEAHAEPIGEAFGKLADQNEKVAAMLDKLAEVGPYGLVFAAVAPIVAQGLVNHGVLPAGFMGTTDPTALIESRLGPVGDVASEHGTPA